MKRSCLVIPLLACAFVLGAVAPSWADNPRITLVAEGLTLREIAEKLSAAAKVSIDANSTANREEKHSFNWTDVPLSRALRDLCAKLNLACQKRGSTGYMLYTTGMAPGPGQEPGLMVKDGVRMFVTSLSIYENRYQNFGPNPNSHTSANMSLQVAVQLPDGDGDLVAGLERVTAKDDLGNVLQSQQRSYSSGYGSTRFPDEWMGGITLPNPNPKAKKLVSLEGDLLVHRKLRPQRVELPLPAPGQAARHEAAGMVFALSRFQPAPPEEMDDNIELPGPRFNVGNSQAGPTIRVRIARPADSKIATRGGSPWQMTPSAIGASGAVYPAQTFRGGGGGGDGQWQVSDYTWVFPNMKELPVKLAWDFIDPDEPVKLVSFRLTDIPLPQPPAVVPQKNPLPPAPAEEATEPQRPFYEKGGPSLVCRVVVAGQPVKAGTVQVGLAPREGESWGTIRWVEVPISPDGLARLTELKPGTYRVSRRFRGEGAAPSAWENTVVSVTVKPGKDATLPPLTAKP